MRTGSLAVLAALLTTTTSVIADTHPGAVRKPAQASVPDSGKVTVELPVSTALFPAGAGAEVANAQCLLCHSVDMVLTQPPRTQDEWKATINKMRAAYGAPITEDQVDSLAVYLAGLR